MAIKRLEDLTNSEIERLISCDKILKSAPPKLAPYKNRNYNKKFKVFSTAEDEEFLVFFSRGSREEDFSLGLIYPALPEQPMLLRCNGFHGTTKKGFYITQHHAVVHSHTLCEKDILQMHPSKPSSITELTGEYYDFDSAVHFFCKKCGIINYTKYFSEYFQASLW